MSGGPTPSTRLLFIRHGETDWNRQHRFQGQLDVPLNATGLAQAERLAARLAGERFDALITSDLQRARQTAAPLASVSGHTPQPMAGLREQHFGIWEGLDAATIQAQHAGLWPAWLRHEADFALPGGESARQFHARVMAAVRTLAAEWAGAQLAVVTHGGVLDMLWRSAHALPLDGLRTCEIPNTGLNRLCWEGGATEGRLRIEVWADAAHLADGELAPLPTVFGRPASP